MSSARTAVLLGAGFSKSVFPNFPTMGELTALVFENLSVKPLITSLDMPLPLFDNGPLSEVNIEEWFELLEESTAYIKDPSIYNRRKLIVETAMQVISAEIQRISRELVFSENQLRAFEKLFKSRCNILTTNYDLILELALAELISQKRIQVGTPYDLHAGNLEMGHTRKNQTYLGIESTKKEDFSTIYKLHGSCDWFSPGFNLSEQIYADISFIENFLSLENQRISRESCDSMSTVIAGPTSLKSSLINSKPLKPIWIKAYSALKSTSHLSIFGSSLHKTDSSLNGLLMEGLPTDVPVHIFDINPKSVNVRVKELTRNSVIGNAAPERINLEGLAEFADNLSR